MPQFETEPIACGEREEGAIGADSRKTGFARMQRVAQKKTFQRIRLFFEGVKKTQNFGVWFVNALNCLGFRFLEKAFRLIVP